MTDVKLPPGSLFVVANSMAISEKKETATDCYNARVLECRLAAVVIAIAIDVVKSDGTRELISKVETRQKVRTLRDVEELIGSRLQALRTAERLLHDGFYSIRELELIFDCSMEEFCEGSEPQLDVLEVSTKYI